MQSPKTILYNTATATPLPSAQNPIHYDGGYFLDGAKPIFGTTEGYEDVEELQALFPAPPTINTATHKLNAGEWVLDLQAKTYSYVYLAVELTAYEIAAKEWPHIGFSKKLVIAEDVAKTPVGAFHFMRFEKGGNPVFYDEPNKQWIVYINEIKPEYSADFNALFSANMLSVIERPEILNPIAP